MFLEFIIYAAIFIAAYTGVEIFRRWSCRRQIFDLPNERSLHTTPTPRGAGLVLAIIALAVYFAYTFFFARQFSYRYMIGASLIALISWLDDLYSISSLGRFVVHSFSAIIIASAVFINSDFLPPGAGIIKFLIFGAMFFWIVWMTNAYNFMDGIDGLAGLQAVSAGLAWLCAAKMLNAPTTGFYAGALAAVSLGFLIQNWHPAKVFMGDVGSAFFGYSFAVLPLLAVLENPAEYEKIFFTGIFLLWFFLFDSAFTLALRMLRGEKFWRAHRTHIYQRLVAGGFSHKSVTILYGSLSASVGILTLCGLRETKFFNYIGLFIFAESVFLVALAARLGKKEQPPA